MEVWVFSYNRGKFLENCVHSIEQCAPSLKINVFDDNSNDPHTLQVLQQISKSHRVITPSDSTVDSKHGGLHDNMQALVDSADVQPADGVICCIQDDMQFVRVIDEQELASIVEMIKANPRLGFVQPTFMKGCNKRKDIPRTRFDKQIKGYYVDRYSNSAGAFYSDVMITDINRLREFNWKFAVREGGSEQLARSLFDQMVYWRDPFIAYLPNVPAYRGKQQTLALRIAQSQIEQHYCPIQIMEGEARQAFISRRDEDLPFAEDYLTVSTGAVKTPWRYYPLQGRRWLKRLNQVELAWRKWTA